MRWRVHARLGPMPQRRACDVQLRRALGRVDRVSERMQRWRVHGDVQAGRSALRGQQRRSGLQQRGAMGLDPGVQQPGLRLRRVFGCLLAGCHALLGLELGVDVRHGWNLGPSRRLQRPSLRIRRLLGRVRGERDALRRRELDGDLRLRRKLGTRRRLQQPNVYRRPLSGQLLAGCEAVQVRQQHSDAGLFEFRGLAGWCRLHWQDLRSGKLRRGLQPRRAPLRSGGHAGLSGLRQRRQMGRSTSLSGYRNVQWQWRLPNTATARVRYGDESRLVLGGR